MKKKIFGIKISTILTVMLCLIAAVVFWLFVKYSESESMVTAMRAFDSVNGYLTL